MITARQQQLSATEQAALAQRRLAGLRRSGDPPQPGGRGMVTSPAAATGHLIAGELLELSVRSVRISDLADLVRMPTITELNQPEIQLSGYSATKSALTSVAPGGGSRPRVFVASVEDRVVGLAHFQPAFSDRRWHVIAIGASTGVYDSSPVEDALLRHGITAAGLRGVKRLFARIPSGTGLVTCFGRVGFAPYATETIFVSESAVNLEESISARRQEQTDTWAIHQLYNATVPRTVQYAEAVTSHRWDLRGADELARSSRRFGWLVDDGHAVAAYGRVSCGKRANAIELLYLPDRTDVLGGLIDTIIGDLRKSSRVKRIFCTLRGYQTEAARELESRGFEPVLEQDLHVKYTTAPVRAPQPEPLYLHSEVIERLPKRVPSFLQKYHLDEAAS